MNKSLIIYISIIVLVQNLFVSINMKDFDWESESLPLRHDQAFAIVFSFKEVICLLILPFEVYKRLFLGQQNLSPLYSSSIILCIFSLCLIFFQSLPIPFGFFILNYGFSSPKMFGLLCNVILYPHYFLHLSSMILSYEYFSHIMKPYHLDLNKFILKLGDIEQLAEIISVYFLFFEYEASIQLYFDFMMANPYHQQCCACQVSDYQVLYNYFYSPYFQNTTILIFLINIINTKEFYTLSNELSKLQILKIIIFLKISKSNMRNSTASSISSLKENHSLQLSRSPQRQIDYYPHRPSVSKDKSIDKSKQEILTAHTITGSSQKVKKSSLKKVKIYQLLRKFNKLKTQNAEKINLIKNLKYQLNDTIGNSIKIQKLIIGGKEKEIQLNAQKEQLDRKINELNIKIKDQKNSLQEFIRNNQWHSFQKRKITDQIKCNKKKIQIQGQNLIKKQKNAMQLDQFSVNLEFSQTKSLIQQFQSPKHAKKKTIDFQFQYLVDELNMNSIKNIPEQNEINSSRQLNQKDLNQMLNHSQDKYLELSFNNHKLLENLDMLRPQVKHKSLTNKLILNRIQNYSNSSAQKLQELIVCQKQSEQLGNKISNLHGQRGYLRGELGIKVQQVSLVNILNNQMADDFKLLQNSLAYLKKYWYNKQYIN